MLHAWLPHVLGGGLLALTCSTLFAVTLAEVQTRSEIPAPVTVDQVRVHFLASGPTLAHVRLTDLAIDCRDTLLVNRRPHTLGRAQEAKWPLMLVDLGTSIHCEQVAAAPIGRVSAGDLDLWLGAGVPGQTPLLRPHEPLGWVLGLCGVTALLGLWSVCVGLRRRRDNVALLARLLARPLAPEAAARPTPGGAYRSSEAEPSLLSRPMRPSPRSLAGRRQVTMVVVGVASLGATLVGAWLVSLLRMQSVWAHGETATAVDFAGARHSSDALIYYEMLKFAYTDAGGQRHFGAHRRLALGYGLAAAQPLTLRYDPADPEDAALSPVIDSIAGEWLALGLFALMALAGALGAHNYFRTQRQQHRRLRELLHAGPEELFLRVLASEKTGPEGILTTYRLATPEGRTIEETFQTGELPFFLEPFGAEVLAIRKPGDPHDLVVLRDDLAPLQADADEPARVRGRYRHLTGTARPPPMPPRRHKRRR